MTSKNYRRTIGIFLLCFLFGGIVGIFISYDLVSKFEQGFYNVFGIDGSSSLDKIKVEAGKFYVYEVIDGETINVKDTNNKKYTVKLLGVDAPEINDSSGNAECFGKESYDYLVSLVKDKVVTMEKDSIQSSFDEHNRLLRYVYVENGTFINFTMIQDGFAYQNTYSGEYDYLTDFTRAQDFAEYDNIGLWAACR